MSGNVVIDLEMCTACGLCTKVCASDVIEVVHGRVVLGRPTSCCSCGHCAAICPSQAISAETNGSRRAFRTDPLEAGADTVERVLRTKRSVREFTDSPIPVDVLERLVEYAEKAPSSGNTRHRCYVVVTDAARIDSMEQAVAASLAGTARLLTPLLIGAARLVDKDLAASLSVARRDLTHLQERAANGGRPVFHGAPAVVCIAAPGRDVQATDDCVIALQYMMLYAETQGLGSCVIGYAQHAHRAMERVLDLPPGHRLFAAGIFGYPRYKYRREIRYLQPAATVWL